MQRRAFELTEGSENSVLDFFNVLHQIELRLKSDQVLANSCNEYEEIIKQQS